MKFDKKPTSIPEQVKLLKERGMLVDDEAFASECLSIIGYYRLSAYWLPYEELPVNGATRSKIFKQGTTFEQVHDSYVFDRNLRVLLLEAIERIEIHIRSRWAYYMTEKYGVHAHLNSAHFTGKVKHGQLLTSMSREVKRSSEVFIEHYRKKYKSPEMPPLWAAAELLTFGQLSQWIENTSDKSISSSIARDLGFPTRDTFEGTMQSLTYVRNICAHHSRLWNRKLVKGPPLVKRFVIDMKTVTSKDATVVEKRVFNIVVLVLRMLQTQTISTSYKDRFMNLLSEVSDENLRVMGFPNDWRTRPVWKP